MKISFNSFAINFKGFHGLDTIEDIKDDSIAYLNHTTSFFRYPDTDEFVISKIKDECKDNPIRIVSAGCSYGEEPYSYAMLLDDMDNKVQIDAFDISKPTIDAAKDFRCRLNEHEVRLLFTRPEEKLSDFEKKCRKIFSKYFNCFNEKKHEYFTTKKEGNFENCNFYQMDIRDLAENYSPDSVDVILCRYLLYHFNKIDEDFELTKNILEKIHKVLKSDGLLIFAEFEEYDFQDGLLKDIGFEKVDDNYDNVYKKVSL